MKSYSIIVIVAFALSSCQENQYLPDPVMLVDYINPMIGTDSRFELSNGNTYPAIALPWGMNFWTPQTNSMGNGWGYQYCSDKIRGIKQTHQASPWLNDYGAFSIFATTDRMVPGEEERQSWFTHKSETSEAYYYSVFLGDYHTTIEVTPTERCALFRITYPETDSAILVIDGFNGGSGMEVFPGKNQIKGYASNNHGGVPENFRNYFIIEADQPFKSYTLVTDGESQLEASKAEGDHTILLIQFDTREENVLNLRVASSFISHEQADRNMELEIAGKDFQTVKGEAEEKWEEQLQRIRVDGGTEDQYITFYTALYRTMLFPRMFYEYNEQGEPIHYSPYNGKVEKGYMFTDNGFWDTFRAVFPFFNLMFREQNAKIMAGLANTYRESGWLPEWASPGHRNVMIGSNSASIIADAYLKGIDIPDIELLYEAILKNSENEGPLESVGRYGVDYYNRLGYIPYDVGINENTARTLEYAYDDFTIARLAESLGRPVEEIQTFNERAKK